MGKLVAEVFLVIKIGFQIYYYCIVIKICFKILYYGIYYFLLIMACKWHNLREGAS